MILWMGPWTQKICRASTWLLALAIVVLSLVPLSYACASHDVAHLAIFFGDRIWIWCRPPAQAFYSGGKDKNHPGNGPQAIIKLDGFLRLQAGISSLRMARRVICLPAGDASS
jgi:hypothetical protein